jgi:hypothetical protein
VRADIDPDGDVRTLECTIRGTQVYPAPGTPARPGHEDVDGTGGDERADEASGREQGRGSPDPGAVGEP